MKKKKNLSNKIKNGRTVQTRDNYLKGSSGYQKAGISEKKLYRPAVVVDSNNQDELAIVKITHSLKGKSITGYYDSSSRTRPYVYIQDDEGNPIKIGIKFKLNSEKRKVPPVGVKEIKKSLVAKPKERKKLRKLKGRS